MTLGFEIGRTYNRRQDIHAVFGGSRQAGIITIPDGPIFIVTGDSGKTSGYHDRMRPDGVFEYFGQGAIGDMQMMRGNSAIAEHVAEGRSLLMFRDVGSGLRFEGEMVCEGHHSERTPDINGVMRQAIVFELRNLEAVVEATDEVPLNTVDPLNELRRRAYEAAGVRQPKPGTKPRPIYERAAEVRDYVLARAAGRCEGCSKAAPFIRVNGSPYLEPHHLTRVSDGGPDHPAHSGSAPTAIGACILVRMERPTMLPSWLPCGPSSQGPKRHAVSRPRPGGRCKIAMGDGC